MLLGGSPDDHALGPLRYIAQVLQLWVKEYFNRTVPGPKLPVVDEIGYLPFARHQANLFFSVVIQRYERGALVLSSNPPFTQWAGALADDQTLTAAMLDRLLHHAHIQQIAPARASDSRTSTRPASQPASKKGDVGGTTGAANTLGGSNLLRRFDGK